MPRDQVEIKFGPARYDSPKAIRRQIEDTATETEQNTINTLINDPDIDLGGGGTQGLFGTIDTYDPSTLEGLLFLEDGTQVEYSNASGTSLGNGDEVVIIEVDGEYVVVGVTQRSGSISPVPLPAAAALSANFPIVTTGLTFPISHVARTGLAGVSGLNIVGTHWGSSVTYDMTGALGLGADVIIGYNSGTPTALNAFARSTASNHGLFADAGSDNDALYCNNSGTIFQMNPTSVNYRTISAGAWNTAAGTYGVDAAVYDTYSQYMWYASYNSSAPYEMIFYRMSPLDNNPVQVPAMDLLGRYTISSVARTSGVVTLTTSVNHNLVPGMTIDVSVTSPSGFTTTDKVITAVTSNTIQYVHGTTDVATTTAGAGSTVTLDQVAGTVRLYAGHGYLLLRWGTDYYIKASGDDTAFVFLDTKPTALFDPAGDPDLGGSSRESGVKVDRLGNLTYMEINGTTSTWHMIRFNTTTLFIDDFDTGIPVDYSLVFPAPTLTSTPRAIHDHVHAESGLVLLPGLATDLEVGEPTFGFYPVIYAYNYVNSTIVYWDPDLVDDAKDANGLNSTLLVSTPVEIATGTFRFAVRSDTSENPSIGSEFRHYELTGL